MRLNKNSTLYLIMTGHCGFDNATYYCSCSSILFALYLTILLLNMNQDVINEYSIIR